MYRLLLALSCCFAVLAGCGETQHPVRQETIGPPDGEAVGSTSADQGPLANRDSVDESALPAGHPPLMGSGGSMPVMPPAEGELTVEAPEEWVSVQPKSRMILAEFALPKAEGDENDGRLTVMEAGGSIKANVERWRGQFAELAEESVEEVDISEKEVTLVDFTGTFKEQRGMMGPVTERPDYRMLAAIIPQPGATLFVKGYGPASTMAQYKENFRDFVESLVSSEEQE